MEDLRKKRKLEITRVLHLCYSSEIVECRGWKMECKKVIRNELKMGLSAVVMIYITLSLPKAWYRRTIREDRKGIKKFTLAQRTLH